MNTVQPIRDKKDIERMKKALGNPRDRLLFIFGINSSLRISDILALTVGDVRGKTELTLREKKTGKTKRFPLNQSIQKALRELVPNDAGDNEPLFASRKGGAITRVQAYRVLNGAARRAEITFDFGTHTLRKTAALHAYKNGTDLAVIMNMLNHSSQRETLRYLGITQDDVDEVFMNLNL
jgi:integrase